MVQTRADYDSPWKEILEQFLPEFLEFFFPAIKSDIDWSKTPEFLDKELQRLLRDAEIGRRFADKLVKVWLNDGSEAWILIHIEVQNEVDTDFERRMFIYNYRLFDHHGREVISLAVLTDDNSEWRPNRFRYGRYGCEVGILFPSVKLIDYADQWSLLEKDNNPFAVVVMAHLTAQSTQGQADERFRWKLRLIRGLYERGYRRTRIAGLLRFIDWVLALPKEMEKALWSEVRKIEEVIKVRYVSSFEQLAIERGLEQGQIRNARANVAEILTMRFESIPPELIEQISALDDLQRLTWLLKQSVTVGTVEEFERLFDGD